MKNKCNMQVTEDEYSVPRCKSKIQPKLLGYMSNRKCDKLG